MKFNTIPLRTSLGLTVIIMGLFTISLVFFSVETYRQLSIENQRSTLVDLVGIKVDDLLARLEDNAAQLGLEIQHDKHFRKAYKNKEWSRLRNLLNNRFHQYFVTAGILKLENIQVLDQDFMLVSEASTGGLTSHHASSCPGASSELSLRTGINRLQPFSKICIDGYLPYMTVTVPIGLRPDGYVMVVTDPSHDLKQLETELGMPLKLSYINGDTNFISSSWNTPDTDTHSLAVDYPLLSESGQHVITASLLVDVEAFFAELGQTRNMIMLVVGIATFLTVLLVRLLSEKLILNPLHSLCTNLRTGSEGRKRLEKQSGHGVISEFAELKELYNVLDDLAMTDPLTGLVNRTHFEQRLTSLNSHIEDPNVQHVACFMDLDRFKIINDTCGHAAGDNLLQQIGELFKGKVRGNDLVARIGGDEFAILLENCPAATGQAIAENIRKAIETYCFTWDGKPFHIGVSIGVVPFTPGSSSLSDIMNAADTACYSAKDKGRNRVHLFQPGDKVLTSHHSEICWSTLITQALEQGKFELFSQPVTIINDRHDSCGIQEIQLMMIAEDGNHIPPGKFLPAAEKYGLVVDIDKWVIQKLCSEVDRFLETGRQKLPVYAVNLSGQSLLDDKFLHFLINSLDSTGLPIENVCFEITEVATIAHLTRAKRFISILQGMGARFSLDNFGSGPSSLNNIKNLKVEFLKVDGSFVRGIDTNEVDFNMMRAIVQMAQIMGMKTIAEAVDNKATLVKLQDIGVDYAQGHYFGKAAPLEDALEKSMLETGRNVIPLNMN